MIPTIMFTCLNAVHPYNDNVRKRNIKTVLNFPSHKLPKMNFLS